MSAYVLRFSEIDREDIELVGGKGANLGEMTRAGFPVPDGFCLTAEAYRMMMRSNGFEKKIREMLEGVEVKDSDRLRQASSQIMRMVSRADVADELVEAIISHYRKLDKRTTSPLVAVRSSATAEDLPEASFAGQQSTFLDIRGEAALIQAVRDAWASLFTARAIFYRETHGFDHFRVALAVPVQLMVASEVSGNMFTINPVNNDKRIIVIEAIWGLGEMIVQGTYTPDHYEVKRADMTVHARQINEQKKELARKRGVNKEYPLPQWKVSRQKLDDRQIIRLAKIGEKLHNHYKFPQDIEWAAEGDSLYVVQTRPITTIDVVEKQSEAKLRSGFRLKLLVKGDAASPGIAWGRPVVLKSAKEISRIKEGDVLVAGMTTPDFVPAMKRAVAIVTDSGGQTSHAAIVSRELGVPAVVGAKTASKILKREKMVTVNGTTGEVFVGAPRENDLRYEKRDVSEGLVETATKVYVNLGEPELAASVAQKHVDGVGLLRAEFVMAQIGRHPKKMFRDGKRGEFVKLLADGLAEFAVSFGTRPVVYRASDFKTNEYRNLIGGRAFEKEEPNPMVGYRGALRYITDEPVFEMELEAVRTVRDKMGYKNLWMMIPFVHQPSELLKVKRLMAANGLTRSNSFKLWMMVEIPSNVILLEEFAKAGIDGISIGTNDLTMLTLGVDRDNEDVASVYDERNPAVLWMIETAVKKAVKLNLTSSLCGQAASEYPELIERLVSWGITSVSVSPDAIVKTRETIALAEKNLVRRNN